MDIYKQLYDNAAVSTWTADGPRLDWDLIIAYIRDGLPRGGRILDFGCYTGGLLARLHTGYERHGVEINKAAAAVAIEGQDAHVWSSINDIPSELRFDAVIASDVIEHVSNPGQFIDGLIGLLTEDGVLIVTTGDADNRLWNRFGANWWYCFYPEHIAFVSRRWFDHFLHGRQLSIERCERFRHSKHSWAAWLLASFLASFYGRFPSIYLRLGNLLRHLFDRPDLASVPGNGISADHLFIVLGRNET